MKDCVNLRRLVVAKHHNMEDDVFMNTKFLRIGDYLPHCDIIIELRMDDPETDYVELIYEIFSGI